MPRGFFSKATVLRLPARKHEEECGPERARQFLRLPER